MIHVCWTSLRSFQWTNTETVLHHLISRSVHVASRFMCNLAYTLFMPSYTLYDYICIVLVFSVMSILVITFHFCQNRLLTSYIGVISVMRYHDQ